MLIDFSSYGTSVLERSPTIRYLSTKLLQNKDSSVKVNIVSEEFIPFMKSQFKEQYVSLTNDQGIDNTISELSDLSIVKQLPSVVT